MSIRSLVLPAAGVQRELGAQAPAVVGSGESSFEEKLTFYPYGTQYYRAPTPLPDEWKKDLEEISAIGFTHIQLRPQWIWHERIRGYYRWDDLDTLFGLAERNGLRIVLKPMLETAPDWTFQELGGTRIGFHGIPIDPIGHGAFYPGGWLPCFDNPDVMDAALMFVRELVGRYKDHPALWHYDAWNEPRSKPMGQCQCPHSIESYREWLRRRYGTVEQMNAALGKAWTSIDTVMPPQSSADHIQLYLWKQWATWAVSGHVQRVCDAIKDVDPESHIMVHTGCCSVITDAAWDATDDILNAAAADRYGTSFPVPLHPSSASDYDCGDVISDWIRRVDPNYWCQEFYTNEANWCSPPRSDTLRQLIWMAISGGAKGFTFWQYRSERFGNESNGWGIREIDGSVNARSEVTDSIARILSRHGSRLTAAKRVVSPVAQLYSKESDLLSRIAAIPEHDIWLEPRSVDYPYKKALFGAHAIYGLGLDGLSFVIPGDALDGVEVLVVSAMEVVDEQCARWLRRFFETGGTAIVEFPFACRDTNTWVSPRRPNHGLSEVLGCMEGERVVIQDDDVAVFTGGDRIRAGGWRVDLRPCGGEPIARWQDGSVAAVRHRFGAGTCYSLGVSLSLSWTDDWTDPAVTAASRLLGEAGVEVRPTPGVKVRRRRAAGYQVWFVFNTTDTCQSIQLPCNPTVVWEGDDYNVTDLTLHLPPRGTWVGEIRRDAIG